jgi:hypothetical protein
VRPEHQELVADLKRAGQLDDQPCALVYSPSPRPPLVG